MCGIVAIYGDRASEWAPHLDTMLDRLSHRGPDDQGTYVEGNIALGQKRLSIVDVAGGRQPIFGEDGLKCVICNGEVYNHLALRDELSHHHFRTRSDTEAILHMFEEEGEEAVSRLDGMFAFVLYDGRDILVARDPLGIKPLYEGRKDGCTFFASELKALEGVVDSIREFPAGHYYSSRSGLVQYYHIPQVSDYHEDEDGIVATLRQHLIRAVRKRLMSDVPLGVFLSGGIDSSIIAAVAREHFDNLNSFSVGIAGSTDLMYARKVADFLGTDHHEYIYTLDEVLEVLPRVIYHLESFDPALVRSAIPTYFVSRLAREHVKVILTGEGSDEVFAGYHYFKEIDGKEALHGESIRILSGLHNLNLQRVDRATMAHSIEGRVPFLDIDFVGYATAIDPSLKLAGEGRMEKWLLRKAFTGYLPDEVLWRIKMEFADGCGSAQLVEEFAENEISDAEFEEQRKAFKDAHISSKEELYYFKLFQGFFSTEGLHQVIGRWRGRYITV
ncbi:MAG: asparagine synthase B [Dehalococcoidia bacterium]